MTATTTTTITAVTSTVILQPLQLRTASTIATTTASITVSAATETKINARSSATKEWQQTAKCLKIIFSTPGWAFLEEEDEAVRLDRS